MDPSGELYYDVIIVGAGIMGSCAAYEASKRSGDHRILLLDQFDFLHHLGSSHGESRTTRTTYPEPYYTPMVLAASRLWDSAQSEAGYGVVTATPHLDIGPADNPSLRSLIDSCISNSVGHRVLNGEQLASEFGGTFRLPDGWIGVVTGTGGVIKPTKAVAMFLSLAARNGVVLRDRTEVTAIAAGNGGVKVTASSGDVFYARKCVVAAGAWTRRLVEAVTGGAKTLPIKPLHTTVCYWKVKEGKEGLLSLEGGFPTFASYDDPYIYGTPSMELPGLIKIAMHGGQPCDPDRREWELSSAATATAMVESVAKWIERVLPACVEAEGGPVVTQACMYSMTPDEDYVLDFLGGEFGKDVVVGGGFSGHGFKMGPLVGRILAEMAIEGEAAIATEAGVEMEHFRIGRFEDDPKGNAKDKEYEDQVCSSDSNP